MVRKKVDKVIRRNILNAKKIIQESEKTDCNEAETRRRIERIFESIMGYDAFKHLSRERAIRGAGETEHVDFAIQIEEGEDVKPVIMVEIKRVTVDLALKHLKQVSSYAINAGCEWILLTNSREWKLYHVSFGKPPITKLIYSWNLLTDDVSLLAERFDLISIKSLKRNMLDKIWQKTNALHSRNLIEAILSESSIRILRRELKKESGISLTPEDIVSGVRRTLNEGALAELENIKLTLSKPKARRATRKKKETMVEDTEKATENIEEVKPSEA